MTLRVMSLAEDKHVGRERLKLTPVTTFFTR